MAKILVTPRSLTKGGEPGLELLKKAGYEVVFCTPGKAPDEAELSRLLPGCVGWLAGVEKISDAVLAKAADLKAISRNGTGVDSIDLEACKRRGIPVLRAEGANARGVAELALGLVLALLRSIPASDARMKAGGWERRQGSELEGRILGVIGTGKIGKLVAKFGLAMGMNVIGADPYPDAAFAKTSGFRYATVGELLAASDVVTLHCPHEAGAKPLIDSAALASMRKGSFLVNTARWGLVEPDATLKSLADGRLAGYAVDAYDTEPPAAHPLLGHERVITTPHVGAFTAESVARATRAAVDNLLAALERERDEMLKGYAGKVLRVNLTTRTTSVEPLKEREVELLLGGRGIAAKYYYDEIGPKVDSLSSENKIFFMTGPLTGTALVSTTKFQLATKSPETRMYLCSNCGGDFGPQLKKAGFDGIIVEGKAKELTWLSLKDGTVEFHDAAAWKGFTSTRAMAEMRAAFGETKAGAMTIGPAGERLVRISYINVDDRAFGRGGPGAVMGSKNLKGIIVKGSLEIEVADPDKVAAIRKAAVAELKTSRANHTRFGTPQYLEVLNNLGCLPTRNFQTATFEGTDKIDAHAMVAGYVEKNYACHRCTVACGKVCVVKEGPYAGARARTEFETVGLLGPNCGIDDFGAIVKGNQLCDELGIDTMSAGNAVALTMELYERGLITKVDTMGIDARFGSPAALIGIIELIAERRGIGDLLAEGMYGVKRARPEWARYILDVKGMPFAAYDPRGFTGNSLTNGTSNRGACHNVGGWTIRAELQSGKFDRYALEGKAALVKGAQDSRAYVDCLGMCTVVRGAFNFSENPSGEVMEAVTDYPFTPKLMEIAQRIYSLERVILNREGIRRKDDLMPDRITKEAIAGGSTKGRTLTAEQYAFMLDDYYKLRGWDADGVVTEETKRKWGLDRLLS